MKIPMEDAKKQYADIAVQYSLPENWENETLFSFDHLSNLVTQLHNSAYTASVKAVNRFATVDFVCFCPDAWF